MNLLFFFFFLIYIYTFFFSLTNEIFDFFGCFSASWDLRLFVLMLRNGANVYLGCWYTWIWIIVRWRSEWRWILNLNVTCCILGGDFGGVWVRYFDVWRSLWDGAWELMQPMLLWAEFWTSGRRLWLFPAVFSFRGRHRVPSQRGWKGYNPISNSYKAQSIRFEEEEKELIKYHFALAWFSLIKNIQRISFMLITGMKQRVWFFFSFFSPCPPPSSFLLNQ